MEKKLFRKLPSIRSTLLVSIGSLCLIPLLIISVVFVNLASQRTNETFVSNTNLLCNIGTTLVNNKINFYKHTMESAVNNNDYNKSMDPDYHKLRDTLRALGDGESSIFNIYYVSPTGEFVQLLDEPLPEGFNPAESSWYKESAAANGEFTFSEPYLDALTNTMTFTMYKAVIKSNVVVGVLGIDVSLADLTSQLESIQYGKDGNLVVTDATGNIIANKNHEIIGTAEATEYSTWDTISTTPNGLIRFNHNNTNYTASYATADFVGWKLLLRVPTREVTQMQRQFVIISAIAFLLVAVICMFIIFIITNLICKSTYIIKDYITNAANGMFNQEIQFKSPIFEFNELIVDLGLMQDSISDVMSQFNESIDDMSTGTASSLEESKNVATSMEQISSTITDISQGTTESATNLEMINTRMEQLSSNMDSIKVVTENVNTMADQTSKLGQTGSEIATKVKETSTQTKLSTTEVSTAIKEVANNIEAIGIMSATISNITQQTNLLALNASIEAARAGEAGKGFAVVAGEIGKLAEETSASARKIDEVVQTINTFVSIAVSKANETSSSVESQEQAVEDSQAIFADIVSSVQDLSQKVNDISTELSAVNDMKNDVLEQVESLSSILEETAAGTEDVANYASTVKTASNQFVEQLSALSTLSDDLEVHIKKFKF